MNQQRIESDLGYVRDVVDRASRNRTAPAIYYLWAAITLVGFTIIDIEPRYASLFWAIAGPAGFVLSMLIGRAHAKRSGEVSTEGGLRHALHWAAMLGAVALLAFGVFAGAWATPAAGQLVLLFLALGYALAGLHLDRALAWVALPMAGGYVALFYLTGPVWSVIGVVVALSLAATPLLQRRAHG